MRHLHDLRCRLQQRRNRVYKTDYRQFETELQIFLKFLDDNPYLRALLRTLNATEDTDFEQWKANLKRGSATFPPSETARAKLCLGILKECAYDPHEQASLAWTSPFSSERNINDRINDLNEAVLDPLVNYLDDRLDDASNILYLLHRFKLKVEWFRHGHLHNVYLSDTRSGEENLDRVLREALFDGGVDFPFSQPDSPSGRADVVSLNNSDDPLVLETKVFDPARHRGMRFLRQGFHQVLRYANDYQQNVGYLVAFNCSDSQLVWPSEDTAGGEYPPRILHDGKVFFLVTIDIGVDRPSASKEQPSSRVQVSRNQLIGQDDVH